MNLESVGKLVTGARMLKEIYAKDESMREVVARAMDSEMQMPQELSAKYPDTVLDVARLRGEVEQAEANPLTRPEMVRSFRALKGLVTGASEKPKVAVFVHGIFSNGQSAFLTMLTRMREDAQFKGWLLATYDYPFHEEMTGNGRKLGEELQKQVGDCEAHLVCHSMGGLIGRLAVLSGETKCIKRLLMIGTPNFGALRTSQLGLLAQLSFAATGAVYAVFRKPGVKDLTRVTSIMKEPIAKGAVNAANVEYVTIPGTFFNDTRSFWDRGSDADKRAAKAGFNFVEAGSLLTAMWPLWRISLGKPHDGIVEEASNSLDPKQGGRHSEKQGAAVNPNRLKPTYMHVNVNECDELVHVEIQHDQVIIDLVKSLLLTADLPGWWKGLSDKELEKMRTRPAWA
jgi:pimeloyl-ACP methyl ester carboxylesterase